MKMPNEYTACEKYGEFVIGIRNGLYSAFKNGQPVPYSTAITRARVRPALDMKFYERDL